MKTACALLVAGPLLVFCHSTSFAQAPAETGMPSSTLSAGINLRAVAGAPFSANVIKESTTVTSDGTRVQSTLSGKMFRDAEGRTRSETELQSSVAGAAPARYVTIVDPVQRTGVVINVASRTATILHLPAASPTPADRLKRAAAQAANRVQRSTMPGLEDMGSMMIEGFSVAGTRRTRSLDTAAAEGKRPVMVTESWFSSELKIELLSTQVTPAETRTTKLVNIVPGEPDPSLFQVPAGYTVQESAVQQ